MSNLKAWRKGARSGWRGERTRHSLAARGIKTKVLSAKQSKKALEAQLIYGGRTREKRKTIGKDISVLHRYAKFQRLGKGYGRYLTEEDYDAARERILKADPGNKSVRRYDRQLESHKRTHHVPAVRMRKYKLEAEKANKEFDKAVEAMRKRIAKRKR
jgi:hypothetical protein